MVNGLISNLQHFSTGDGPGIRTTVFMQGCNLKCPWCHNPETIPKEPVLLFYENSCIKCGLCVTVCENDVHTLLNDKHLINNKNCIHCGKCEKVCASSLKVSGKYMTVDEVFDYIYKDIDYIKQSGGGVTISGGEPLIQADFVALLSKKCKENDIGVIIDTAGNVPFSNFEAVVPYADTFYYDIKGDRLVYDTFVFGNYDIILSNLQRLVKLNCDIKVRIPIIPGVNNDNGTVSEVYETIRAIGIKKVSLLPFHRLGCSKYSALNLQYRFLNTEAFDIDKMKEISGIFIGMDVEIEN